MKQPNETRAASRTASRPDMSINPMKLTAMTHKPTATLPKMVWLIQATLSENTGFSEGAKRDCDMFMR
jgi:hypothetical protein